MQLRLGHAGSTIHVVNLLENMTDVSYQPTLENMIDMNNDVQHREIHHDYHDSPSANPPPVCRLF